MTRHLDPTHLDAISGADAKFDKFMHHISHDVRASAQAMTDIPQWVIEDVADAGLLLPEDTIANLELLTQHSKRLNLMVENLATYYLVGRDQKVMPVDPGRLLGDLIVSGVFDPAWAITLDVTPCAIEVGERDIMTLFKALISNAITHHDRQGGEIRISSRMDKDQLSLLFADDGPGIEVKFQEKIFDMMTTLQPRDRIEGSGLGLAISKKICELYGCGISVKSSPPNRGSLFRVTFPVVRRDTDP